MKSQATNSGGHKSPFGGQGSTGGGIQKAADFRRTVPLNPAIRAPEDKKKGKRRG